MWKYVLNHYVCNDGNGKGCLLMYENILVRAMHTTLENKSNMCTVSEGQVERIFISLIIFNK